MSKLIPLRVLTIIIAFFLLGEHSSFAQKNDTATSIVQVKDSAKSGTVHSDTTHVKNQKSNNNKSATSPFVKDTTMLKKDGKGFFSFFTRLFNKNKKKLQADTSAMAKKKAKHSDTTATAKKPHKNEFDLTKGGISYTTLYTQGVNLNTGVTGLYTLAHVYQDFDAFSLPFKMQGTGVMDNGQFERSYSSFSIDFDEQTYLNRLRQKALNDLLNKEASEKAGLGKTPTAPHMNLTDSLTSFESVRKQLMLPSYQSDMQLTRTLEKKEEDSLYKDACMDTTNLHKLRQKIAAFEQLEKRYNQLFAIKKNYNSLNSKDSSATALEKDGSVLEKDGSKLDKDATLLNSPEGIEKILEQNHDLNGYEKFMMGFKKFSIGQSNPEISEFTLHNFMMKGVNMTYKIDDVYITCGYGKQQAVVNPFLMTGITVPTYNRTVEFVRAGLGSEQSSNLYATLIHITDPGSTSSLGETNTIMDLSKKIICSKNLDFEGEIAQSFFKYVPNRVDSNPLPLTAKNDLSLAYALRGHGVLPATKTSLKLEYDNIGGDFITLGNPFLISGSKIYRADLTQPIGSKLKVGIGGAHTIENSVNNTGTGQTDNWIDFSVAYKPTKDISMEAKYSPRELQEQEGTVVANNITSDINQMSFMSNISSRLFGHMENTNIFVGNFQFITPGNSVFLVQNTNLSYYMLNEVFSLAPSSSMTIASTEARNGWTGSLSQMISQGVYNQSVGKSFTFSLGPQWVEQPGVLNEGVGVVGSIMKSFAKWGQFSIQLNYRNGIDKPFYMNTAQLILSSTAFIMW